jgi:predicted RNA-binding protein with PUA-like domain
MEIVREAEQDTTDETGKWIAVLVSPLEKLPAPVSLKAMKAEPALAGMEMIRQSRLSVSPVSDAEYGKILEMAGVS